MEKKEFAIKVLIPLKSTIFKEILETEEEDFFISPLDKYKSIALRYYNLKHKFISNENDIRVIQEDFIYYYFIENDDYKYCRYRFNPTEKTLQTKNNQHELDISSLDEEMGQVRDYEQVINEKILDNYETRSFIVIKNPTKDFKFPASRIEIETFFTKFEFDHFLNSSLIFDSNKIRDREAELWEKLHDHSLSGEIRYMAQKEYESLSNLSIGVIDERLIKKKSTKKFIKNRDNFMKKIVELIYNYYGEFYSDCNKKQALYLIHSNLGWAPSESELTEHFKTIKDKDAEGFIDNHISKLHYKKRPSKS